MLVLKVKYNGSWTDLDLYGNESINFNKSVLEVQEFDKRSSDFTKQFRLPGTETNNRIMGNIFKINLEDSSFDPKQSLECAITISGQVLLVGSMRLEKIYVNVQKNDYEVVIYSQLGSLASSITEKTLCDLDFSEYTHSLTYQNIGNSWNLSLFGGDIVYPFIHYGYDDEDTIPDFEFTNTQWSFDQPSNALQFWYYKPAIRVNKVIEKIINEAGYEMSSDYLTSQEFDKVYMPLSFSGELGVQTIEDISFYASLSTDDNIPDGEHNVVFDIEISDTSNNYNNITGEYTLTKEGRYSFKVDYTLSTNDCCEYEGDPYFHLYDRWVRDRGGNKTYFQDRFLGYQCNVSNVPFQKYITIDVGSSTSTSDWKVGDKIAFGTAKIVIDCESYTLTSTHTTHADFEYYACEDTTTPITLRVYTGTPVNVCANPDIPPVVVQNTGTITDNGPCASIHTCEATIGFLSTFLLYDTPAEPGDGSDVVISENMNCDTTQLDFLKGIFTHFNMVVVPDPNDPVKLIIEPYVNWVNASDVEIRDWTNYLDTSKDVIVQPLVDNDNRYVKFTDAEDTDKLNKYNQENYNEVFGQYTYDSGSQIVQNTKEISTIFSPTPSEQLDGSSRMIVPKLYEEDDAGNLRPFASNPRLLYYNGLLDINDTYYVRDENDVVYSHNQYPCMSIVQYLNTTIPTTNVKTLTWDKVYNYYTQLSGYNSINAEGSYYELFWKDYFVDIYDSDSRIITAYFNIPFQEFIQVKLNDRIQISGLFGNTQWRINRIIDYDLTDPGMTKVELVKSLLIPTPVPIERNYILEKCDEAQQTIASYSSHLPLEAGRGAMIEGYDICYFVVSQTNNSPQHMISQVFDSCNECNIGVERFYTLEPYAYGWAGQDTQLVNYDYTDDYVISDDCDYGSHTGYNGNFFRHFWTTTISEGQNFTKGDTIVSGATFDAGVGVGQISVGFKPVNLDNTYDIPSFTAELIWDGNVVASSTIPSTPDKETNQVCYEGLGVSLFFNKTSAYPREVEMRYTIQTQGSPNFPISSGKFYVITSGGYKQSLTGFSNITGFGNDYTNYPTASITSIGQLSPGTPVMVLSGSDQTPNSPYQFDTTQYWQVKEHLQSGTPSLTGATFYDSADEQEWFLRRIPQLRTSDGMVVKYCDDPTGTEYFMYFNVMDKEALIPSNKGMVRKYSRSGIDKYLRIVGYDDRNGRPFAPEPMDNTWSLTEIRQGCP